MVAPKVFISYSREDKKLAGELKKAFESFGLEAFVAHDDIESGSQWEAEILKNLENTDFFMPIETEHLRRSHWCQQEIGIALVRKKIIIPLLPDTGYVDPDGFHGKYQGFPINTENVRLSVQKLLIRQGLAQEQEESEIEKRLLVFERSDSWAEAGENARSLMEMESELTDEQKIAIARIATSNSQISGSFAAQGILRHFLRRNLKLIPKEYLEQLL
jgi:hypothetical protein